jgi:hypothetical protein
MSKKVKLFGRAAVETTIATAKFYGGKVQCMKCGHSLEVTDTMGLVRAFNTFEFDHVYPESLGGHSRRDNCAVICGSYTDTESGLRRRGCNQLKGEALPENFYGPERLAEIKAIQAVEVAEAEWMDVNDTLCRTAPESAWFKRFAPAALKREYAGK